MEIDNATLESLFGAPALGSSANLTIRGVGIDSRCLKPFELFVAVRGETFDGHDFISAAVAAGASAVICERPVTELGVPLWVVPDTVQALAALAKNYRQRHACPVVALTGSNGKTTVKEMIAAILPQPAHATPGNLNNHIGVPLSLFQLQSSHRYAVFELGANHPGEIAHTVEIVKPQVTLINNIAPAHIEGFGSIDGVARAKGEIHQGLMSGGTAVINDDDTYAHFWDSYFTSTQKVLRFSQQNPSDVYVRELTMNDNDCASFVLITPQGEGRVTLKVPGKHNVSNALAASTCCLALGIDLSSIIAALSSFTGVAGRMTYRTGKNQSIIIDDTYNANLRSTLSALDVLALRRGQRVFVFGDMKELGDFSQQHHHDVGIAAREHGIDLVFTYGNLSQHTAMAFSPLAKHYSTHNALVDDLLPILNSDTTVLVKGSRSSEMEKVVQHLLSSRSMADTADEMRGG